MTGPRKHSWKGTHACLRCGLRRRMTGRRTAEGFLIYEYNPGAHWTSEYQACADPDQQTLALPGLSSTRPAPNAQARNPQLGVPGAGRAAHERAPAAMASHRPDPAPAAVRNQHDRPPFFAQYTGQIVNIHEPELPDHEGHAVRLLTEDEARAAGLELPPYDRPDDDIPF